MRVSNSKRYLAQRSLSRFLIILATTLFFIPTAHAGEKINCTLNSECLEDGVCTNISGTFEIFGKPSAGGEVISTLPFKAPIDWQAVSDWFIFVELPDEIHTLYLGGDDRFLWIETRIPMQQGYPEPQLLADAKVITRRGVCDQWTS